MFMNPADFEFRDRKIPERLHDGLTHYLKHHIPVGDFLTAVLQNDLKEMPRYRLFKLLYYDLAFRVGPVLVDQ